MRSTVENFVIEGIGRGIEVVNLEASPEYAELVKWQKDKKLKAKFPHDKHINSHARNYHTMDMMVTPNPETGKNEYLPGILMVEPSDEDGNLELTPEQEALAKLLIRVLRSQAKRDVRLAKHSRPFSDGWDYVNLFPVSTPKKVLKGHLKDGIKDAV